jgi:hypothetical protein
MSAAERPLDPSVPTAAVMEAKPTAPTLPMISEIFSFSALDSLE